jgi:VWFA-related protein
MSFIPSESHAAVATCLVSLLLPVAFPVAQQPPPTFRTGVEAVVMDVSVLDKDRRPVRGLTVADFTIVEDGKPQDIRTFKAIDLEDVVETLPARWVREVAPDVRRNDEFRDHRVVVIVLDDASMGSASDVLLAKRLGRTIVDQLPPDDVAAVVYTLKKDAGQVFTKDRAKLRAAVERFNGSGGESYTMKRATVDTLQRIAEWMAELPEGRKALFFVSDGLPLDVEAASEPKLPQDGDVGDLNRSLYLVLSAAIEAAQRANVSVYAADPGGLRQAATTREHDFLKTLSNNTAGFAVVDTNDPAPGIAQVYRENGSYYLLGYQPTNSRTQGRFRKVEVRVNRPGVTVRTRSGYVEPAAEKPARKPASRSEPSPAATALVGVIPVSDIALQVNAAPFARPGSKQADVAVAVDAAEAFPAGSTATVDEVDVLVHAYDMQARLRASDRVKVKLAFRPGMGASARFGVLSRLTLNPGRYQLRLAVRSSALGKNGSVYYDLEVPDFSKPELSLSGIVLDVTPPVLSAPRGRLSAILPVLPTAQREFSAGEQVGAFLRVYQGGKGPLSPVVVSTRVVDGRDTDVFGKTETLGQDRFGPTRAADYRMSLPLANVAKGSYLVSITATRGTLTVKREVRITLR